MKKNSALKYACALLAATALTACGGPGVEGAWVEPIPGMEDMVQGISLEKGGKASSINMATLQYEKWTKEGDRLYLSGKSIGNGQTIEFTDTFAIASLTEDEMQLKKGGLTINYKRQK